MINFILWLLSALLAYGICSRTHGKMPNGIFMLFLLLAPLMLWLSVFGMFCEHSQWNVRFFGKKQKAINENSGLWW